MRVLTKKQITLYNYTKTKDKEQREAREPVHQFSGFLYPAIQCVESRQSTDVSEDTSPPSSGSSN